jgi:hypothetical protein
MIHRSSYQSRQRLSPVADHRGVKGSSSTRTAVGSTQDTNQPSPFAQMLSSLQQLEQSNPPRYQEVTNRM